MTYYFDDDGPDDNSWKEHEFKTDAEAISWGENLRSKLSSINSIVYDEDFRCVKEWIASN